MPKLNIIPYLAAKEELPCDKINRLVSQRAKGVNERCSTYFTQFFNLLRATGTNDLAPPPPHEINNAITIIKLTKELAVDYLCGRLLKPENKNRKKVSWNWCKEVKISEDGYFPRICRTAKTPHKALINALENIDQYHVENFIEEYQNSLWTKYTFFTEKRALEECWKFNVGKLANSFFSLAS